MLVGFFKKALDCECYVIKYVDRIWLSGSGDAEISRTFIVKVNENSAESLKEIRILLPFKHLTDLVNINETCFLPFSEYHFNSPEICTTQQYRIIQNPPSEKLFNSFGIINHDGIEDIKVFTEIDQSTYPLGKCSVIRLKLPSPLEKGESTEIRMKFRVPSLFNKISPPPFPNYSFEFPYFSQMYIDEIDQLNRELEIKVKPILDMSHFSGGFDIILYFPPEYVEVSEIKAFKKKYDDPYDIRGKETSEKRLKFIWRLREFLKQKGLPEETQVGIGQEVAPSGILTGKYDVRGAVERLRQAMPQEFRTIDERITKAGWVGFIAIVLAIITLSFTLYEFIFK